jgi:hypothetical protein
MLMPEPSVDHVLLTRFNLPSKGYESLIRAQEGWLRDRMGLFEKYCLPSIRNQSDKNFRWIIYFDPESPQWLMDRIREINTDGVFSPVFRAEVMGSELIEDIDRVVGQRKRYLLTTNLDNDDGLAADFVSRIRTVAPSDGSVAVYLTQGLIRSGDATYLHTDPDNAFCSVLAPWSEPKTCWADWHNLLGQSMPVVRLGGPPAWLQVVHGSNVSNRVHGRRVSPVSYARHFPGLLEDISQTTRAQLLKDRLLLAPARLGRETVRAAAKSLVQATSGRSRIDQLKIWWATQTMHLRSWGALGSKSAGATRNRSH